MLSANKACGVTTVTDPYYSSVSLLLPMSANFTDYSPSPKTITNNNATISSAQYIFPPASGNFNGSNASLVTPISADFNFGTSDFTIEVWVNLSNLNVAALIDFRPNSIYLFIEANGVLSYGNTTFTINSGNNALSANIWTYIAVTRSTGTVKCYVNGSQVATGADSSNYSLDPSCFIGRRYISVASNFYYITGYLYDLRITKGVARTITTPTAPFPTS